LGERIKKVLREAERTELNVRKHECICEHLREYYNRTHIFAKVDDFGMEAFSVWCFDSPFECSSKLDAATTLFLPGPTLTQCKSCSTALS
jgi:hypothetical protein